MNDSSTALHTQLRAAGIPVVGVMADQRLLREQWRLDFAPEATDEQKAQATQIITAFDPDAKPAPPTKRTQLEKALGMTLAEIKAELGR